MQRLNRGMMERYEIPAHIPGAVNAVQFGMGERLLGVMDRLIGASAAEIGIACVSAGEPLPGEGKSPAALLREQDGMFTVFERGYRDDAPVNKEIVVQSILRVAETDEELDALAAEPGMGLALIDGEGEEVSLRQAARLLAARMGAGLGGLEVICLGDTPDVAEKVRGALPALAPEAGEAFPDWLSSDCAFLPALAEGFAFRAEAREAAKLCTDMNYADGMIHLAEPCARLTVQAGEGFRKRARQTEHLYSSGSSRRVCRIQWGSRGALIARRLLNRWPKRSNTPGSGPRRARSAEGARSPPWCTSRE